MTEQNHYHHRGTENTEDFNFLICPQTTANKNHHASGKPYCYYTQRIAVLSDRYLPIRQKNITLCELCVSSDLSGRSSRSEARSGW
jgi:hypothetical protein